MSINCCYQKNATYDEDYYYQLMHKYSISENDLAFLNTGYYYDVYLLELEHSLIDFLYVIFLYMFVCLGCYFINPPVHTS